MNNFKNHPIQPLIEDEHGVVRFKKNEIVRYLLDNGGIDLNKLHTLTFKQEDWDQFTQLIGYSVCGAYDLDYTDKILLETAEAIYENNNSSEDYRDILIENLRNKLNKLRYDLGIALADLFEKAEEDLIGEKI